ncbi:putative membrane protein [Micromonospora coriariae]|nr:MULTISPECIES: SHOCT domain-containing protein [Micromonospora]SCF03550.1 putative membrane protein [Micromonospora coriariae]
MFWHHNGMGGFGYLLMLLNSLAFVGLLAAGGWVGWRALRDHGERRVGDPAERLLAERFARGEINDEEYQRRLDTLRHV